MTATEKVLGRKDGASLVVGVVLALAVLQFLSMVTLPLASKIMSNNMPAPEGSFDQLYISPLVALILQVVALELLIWVVIGVRSFVYSAAPKKKKK